MIKEYNIYKKLGKPESGVLPVELCKWDKTNIMVMNLLGPSLDDIVKKYKRLRLSTVLILGIQMISIVKHIHSRGYIHRDIKTKNIVINPENPSRICFIDFGLACRYLETDDSHKVYKSVPCFYGTERYASIAAHDRKTQSRKDDLESILYTLVYLYKGRLPWQHCKENDKLKRLKMIGKVKKNTSIEELCKDMPREFHVFGNYIKQLDFDEKPHYTSISRMFENLYNKNVGTVEWVT